MALKTQISGRAVREVALGKANAARLSGEYKRRRTRITKVLRFIGNVIVAVLVFGVVVSLTSYSRTPTVHVPAISDSSVQVNEVTRLYPVTMERVVAPHTIDDIANAVRASAGPVSIGGGRYSMGGQTAVPDGVQIDMRSYHGVISLDTAARVVVVKAGTP